MGTFSLFSLLLSCLPPHAQLASRAMLEAYHSCPLHYSQWPGDVARISKHKFCTDTTISFSTWPSGGIYGNIRTTGCKIICSTGISPITAWVDNHIFMRILWEHLDEYNQLCQRWHNDIMARGQHHNGRCTWYGRKSFRMALWKNLMKTVISHCETSPAAPPTSVGLAWLGYFNKMDITQGGLL